MSESEPLQPFRGGARLFAVSAIVAIVGLVGWIVGLVLDARHALFSLLTAYAYLATLLVGALALLMMMHAARAEWPVALRRLVEAMVATIPLLTLFFIPLALGLAHLYPWAGATPLDPHVSDVVHHQGAWWSRAFFIGRSVVYLGSWLASAVLLRLWSLRQDADGGLHWSQKAERLSGAGLVLLGFTLTFAAFDWFMSLTPEWNSSIYGIYVFAGGFVAALAFLVLLMAKARRPELLGRLVTGGHFLSVGKLIFAHVIFWAYVAFDQYFIIWIADVPHEASWWVPRQEGWAAWSIVLAVAHFAVPFAVLLNRDLKRDPRKLGLISLWLLVTHYLDVYWLVMPALSPERPRPHLVDLAALALVLGAALALGVWRARGAPMAPARAPGFDVSIRYEGT